MRLTRSARSEAVNGTRRPSLTGRHIRSVKQLAVIVSQLRYITRSTSLMAAIYIAGTTSQLCVMNVINNNIWTIVAIGCEEPKKLL